MFKEWNSEFNQFLLLIFIGAVAGWTLGYPSVGIVLVSVPYSLWMLLRVRELVKWLRSAEDEDPPEREGLWGTLFETLYKQKKRQKRQLDNLYDIIIRAQQSTNAIKDGVVVVDRNGNLEWWNDACGKYLGFRQPTDQASPITNLLRDPRFIHYFEAKNYDKSLEIPSAINANITLQFQITVFGQGDQLIVVRDVSRLHQLEQMRKDFVANVSHELRTPLTVIKGYLETFLDLISTTNPQLKRGLTQMHNQTQRMELLINDLLMLSRLETENTSQPMKPISAPNLIKQVYNDALALNDEKQHAILLEVDEELDIYGDENELRSAFSNLLVNAVKYTPEKGSIVVRWYRDEQGVFMEVEDNGLGIDPVHIPRLTERFYRADESRNAKSGGTGLGLAIVKHVLIHHNAKLHISSSPGEGSVFSCHFPRKMIATKPKQSVA